MTGKFSLIAFVVALIFAIIWSFASEGPVVGLLVIIAILLFLK